MPQFILKINLGNDMMQTGYDISSALQKVAITIEDYTNISDMRGRISDKNGNTVGSWQIK